MIPDIIEIRYSIKLTESQWDILDEKCRTGIDADVFVTEMSNQTRAENIDWNEMFGSAIFLSLNTNDNQINIQYSINKVIKFLEANLGTE